MKLIIDDKELEIEVADTFMKKLKGLTSKKEYKKAMLFKNTTAIHTFGMKMDIDVIYLDKNYKIIKIIKQVKPNKILMPIKTTKHIIEIATMNYKEIKIKKTS